MLKNRKPCVGSRLEGRELGKTYSGSINIAHIRPFIPRIMYALMANAYACKNTHWISLSCVQRMLHISRVKGNNKPCTTVGTTDQGDLSINLDLGCETSSSNDLFPNTPSSCRPWHLWVSHTYSQNRIWASFWPCFVPRTSFAPQAINLLTATKGKDKEKL